MESGAERFNDTLQHEVLKITHTPYSPPFQEKESRDELGLGSVRDSFADQLFPGTSTIQTRLRYTLFVP